jgi:hypothetical protein
MATANYIQHRLAFFFFNDFERAFERRQNFWRIINRFAVAGESLRV